MFKTFLFTDVEGSTRFWVERPDRAAGALALHDEIIRSTVVASRGSIVKGTGDGFLAEFDSPGEAVEAAVRGQMELQQRRSELYEASQVRMAVHTGEVEERDGDYSGFALHRCQRLMAAGHGGQILVSEVTAGELGDRRASPTLVDLGEHRLPDLTRPEHVFQVVHPRLKSRFPPIHAVDTFRSNLPAQLTSFVGRRHELEELRSLVEDHRLVTLTGSAGAGKTRLAIESASQSLAGFPDGTIFVELAPIVEGEAVARQLLDSMNLAIEPDTHLLDLAASYLEPRTALLVLDNCEHVLDSAANLAHYLLQRAPDLRILATSREHLGVPGEVIYRVPSLGVPETDHIPPDLLMESDAVRLFVERASLTDPGFSIDEDPAPIARICRRLDGIPLAIELAAGKAGSLSPGQIADRLSDRFELLTGGSRVSLPRHQTLLAAIEWGYELLTQSEQRLLGRLGVFRGGFELDAARAVCHPCGSEDVWVVLLRLVDKSMVVRVAHGSRFRLLESVSEFAVEKLRQSGEFDAVATNHALYFRHVVESARPGMFGDQQVDTLNQLAQDHENVHLVLSRALSSGDHSTALRIISAVWPFWKLRNHLSDGFDWMEKCIAGAVDPDRRLLADSLVGAGDLATDLGYIDKAHEYLERGYRLAEEIDEPAIAAAALAKLTSILHKIGNLKEATATGEDALQLSRTAGDAWVQGRILASLALLHQDQGNLSRAEELAEEAVTVSRESANSYLIGDALLTAGEIALNRGSRERAQALIDEACVLAEEVGLDDVLSWALSYQGKLSLLDGNAATARLRLEEGLAGFRTRRLLMGETWAMLHIGRVHQLENDPSGARRAYREALQTAVVAVRPDAPLVLEAMGALEAEQAEPERAALLLAAARKAREQMGLELPPVEAAIREGALESVNAQLDPGMFAILTERGSQMEVQDAALMIADSV